MGKAVEVCENDCGMKAVFVTFNKEANTITAVCPKCYFGNESKYVHTVYVIPAREIVIREER